MRAVLQDELKNRPHRPYVKAVYSPNQATLEEIVRLVPLLTIDQSFNVCGYNLLQVARNFLNIPIPPSNFK